jgi:hypothetical protein
MKPVSASMHILGFSGAQEILNIDFDDLEYYGLLRLMISIDDNLDLEETIKVLLKQILHPIPTNKVSIFQT